jgi:hypothetical protein
MMLKFAAVARDSPLCRALEESRFQCPRNMLHSLKVSGRDARCWNGF